MAVQLHIGVAVFAHTESLDGRVAGVQTKPVVINSAPRHHTHLCHAVVVLLHQCGEIHFDQQAAQGVQVHILHFTNFPYKKQTGLRPFFRKPDKTPPMVDSGGDPFFCQFVAARRYFKKVIVRIAPAGF